MKSLAMMRLCATACVALLAVEGTSAALAVESERHAPLSAATAAYGTAVGKDVEAHFANFTDPIVKRIGDQVVVTFSDKQSGREYRYLFTEERNGRDSGAAQLAYTTTTTGWVLDRVETDELSRDAAKWAGIYAIAAVIPGGLPAVVGAAIEGAWSAHAASYYGHGNCIKIHYWLSVSEIEYGSRGCW